jgi:ArsR family transcriptional regulator
MRKGVPMRIRSPEIFELQAEFCKGLANPKRLMIIASLGRRDLSVGEIATLVATTPPNVSQHLRLLREKNVVHPRKEGQTVYYHLVDPRLVQACCLIRTVLLDDLKRRGLVAQEVRPEDLIED